MENFTPQKLEEILKDTFPQYKLRSRFTLTKNFDPTSDVSDFEFITITDTETSNIHTFTRCYFRDALEGEQCKWYLLKDLGRVMKGISA